MYNDISGESKYYRVEAMNTSGNGYVLQNLAETMEEAEEMLDRVVEEYGFDLDSARIIKIMKKVTVYNEDDINSSGSMVDLPLDK